MLPKSAMAIYELEASPLRARLGQVREELLALGVVLAATGQDRTMLIRRRGASSLLSKNVLLYLLNISLPTSA